MATAGGRGAGYASAMDLTYPPEAEAYRAEVRTWLEGNLPAGWFEPGFSMTPDQRREFVASWTERLYAGGWICAGWPAEYGGKGLDLMRQVVVNEEFARANAPMRADFFGDTLVGPTLLQWGTEEQKARFIPGILRGEIAWCQGFSEPDAGSDLASLATSASTGRSARCSTAATSCSRSDRASSTRSRTRRAPGSPSGRASCT